MKKTHEYSVGDVVQILTPHQWDLGVVTMILAPGLINIESVPHENPRLGSAIVTEDDLTYIGRL